MKKVTITLAVVAIMISTNLFAQIGRTYPDGHGGRVFFPFGDISFADKIISYNSGNPSPQKEDKDPSNTLGIPNYNEEKDINFTSLGNGGSLVVKFTDNILYDIDGIDLYIFEIGGDESFEVYISKNGKNWIDVGKGAGTTKIDIKDFVKPTDIFRYVKLVDLKTDQGEWPGADIDAIGAIGSTLNFQLNGSVLFETGKSTLNTDKTDLLKIAGEIKKTGGKVIVEGYTDNVGSPESNLNLSKERAETVKKFFIDSCKIDSSIIITNAYGEDNPTADNNTPKGRQKNRRVEIVLFPKTDNTGNVTGIWETNWGTLRIYKYGDIIAGWYTDDYGEISGKLIDDHTISGIWAENGSDRECEKDLYGRHHIGKVILKFNNDFSSFTTKWGYCSDEPTNTDWTGKRK
jgi:outer membrane protein OmpA-like peptidoglycan-associated protein